MDIDIGGEVNKRLTMNLLMQGAASHVFLTAHHLVRTELNQLDPRLIPFYDRFAIFSLPDSVSQS